jgi:hypothetical protein
MGTGVGERFVVRGDSRSASIARGPKRSRIPFRVKRGADASEQPAAIVIRAQSDRWRIKGG